MTQIALRCVTTPARLVHHGRIARRLRLEVRGVQGRPALARRVEEELRASAGVEHVAADPRTGRVLVVYAPGSALLDRLREVRPSPSPDPAIDRNISRDEPPWHARPLAAIMGELGTGPGGLDPSEAQRRARTFGPNAVREAARRSRLEIFASQFANLPAALLAGSSFLSAAVRDWLDAGAILSAIGLNAAIGYRIEYKNEDLLASWRRMEAGEAQVLRGRSLMTVPSPELVVGDVVLCRVGDTVPADARVIDAHRLAADEAGLTGESEPQRKGTAPVRFDAPLAERTSMLYAGTIIAAGHGRAVVVATGPRTEAARIQTLLEREQAPRTPLEERLDVLGNRLALAGVGAGALATVVGLLRARPLGQVLRGGVALAVAAIPEGLPVVSSAALVRSMQRMRERGMVVRRLASAETLGGVTVVCADKTGTLTCNEMRLEVLDLGEGGLDPKGLCARPDRLLDDGPTLALAAAVLNSDVDVQRRGRSLAIAGSSTERALVEAAARAGLDRAALRRAYPRRALHERDAGVHYVISVHDAPAGEVLAFVKGAPEQVLGLCDRTLHGPLDDAARRRLQERNDALAGQGLRVLALGWRRLPHGATGLEPGYTLIGLAGLRDPLRPGAAAAIRRAAQAGIRTIILTGDQQRTAEAVARAVGLRGDTVDGPAVTRLLAADGPAVDALLDRVAVFSRVSPAEKLAIVHALRRRGAVVAMAGDGINDAPALKAADVGIAIGIHASDVARQAADVVLANEDLEAILSAVGEGRIVQDNLRRAVRYLVATNISEIALVLGAGIVGAAEPLGAMALLWLNLLSDTLPALALALEPGEPDVLDRDPAPPGAPLLTPAAWRSAATHGLLLGGLGAVGLAVGGPPVAFSTLSGAELGYAVVCRAEGTPPGPRFVGLVGAGVALQVAALSVPLLRVALGLPRAVSPLELAGLAVGLLAPWAAPGATPDPIIVRHGRAAHVVTSQQPEVM